MNIIGMAFIVLFVAQAFGTLAYLLLISRLMRRLEAERPDIHRALGGPQLLANNTPKNNFLVIGWLWRREYASIVDPSLATLAGNVRALFLSLVVGFVIMMLLFVALQILHVGLP